MGPNARKHLQPLTDTSLANEDFPFGTSRTLTIAGICVRALRLSYVGALGWELYIPWADAASVYTALTAQPIQHAGYHAMDSLRLEKGYRHWGHDITDSDTPVEAGLSFTVDWDKTAGFMGRDALLEQRQSGPTKRLVLLQLADSDALLMHDEPVWSEGQQSRTHSIRGLQPLLARYLSPGVRARPQRPKSTAHARGRSRSFLSSRNCRSTGRRHGKFAAPHRPRKPLATKLSRVSRHTVQSRYARPGRGSEPGAHRHGYRA